MREERGEMKMNNYDEKMMGEKLNKKTGVFILAGISLLAIIIVISVIATGKN